MTMQVIKNNGVSVVVPGVSRLDASQAEGFRLIMKNAGNAGECSLVLDLDSVDMVDSTILGVVVGTFRDLPEGGRLVLCTLSENVASLLHLTHLDRILRVYTNREDAVAALVH